MREMEVFFYFCFRFSVVAVPSNSFPTDGILSVRVIFLFIFYVKFQFDWKYLYGQNQSENNNNARNSNSRIDGRRELEWDISNSLYFSIRNAQHLFLSNSFFVFHSMMNAANYRDKAEQMVYTKQCPKLVLALGALVVQLEQKINIFFT